MLGRDAVVGGVEGEATGVRVALDVLAELGNGVLDITAAVVVEHCGTRTRCSGGGRRGKAVEGDQSAILGGDLVGGLGDVEGVGNAGEDVQEAGTVGVEGNDVGGRNGRRLRCLERQQRLDGLEVLGVELVVGHFG